MGSNVERNDDDRRGIDSDFDCGWIIRMGSHSNLSYFRHDPAYRTLNGFTNR